MLERESIRKMYVIRGNEYWMVLTVEELRYWQREAPERVQYINGEACTRTYGGVEKKPAGMVMLNGLRVVATPFLTEPGEPVEVRRTWKERLLTRPWRPFKATRTFVPQVPKKSAVIIGGTMLIHPVMLAVLREELRRMQ